MVSLRYLSLVAILIFTATSTHGEELETLSQQLTTIKKEAQETSTCDEKQARLQEKVAAKIDRHFGNDYKNLSKLAVERLRKKYVFTPMGSVTVLIPKKKISSKPNQFKFSRSMNESWRLVDREMHWYHFPKRSWYTIYADASSMLRDDEDRRQDGQCTEISPQDIPRAKKAYEEFLSCYMRSDCRDQFNFSPDSLVLMKSLPHVAPLIEFLNQPKENRSDFNPMEFYLTPWVDDLGEDILPWLAGGVRTLNRDTLEVSMDAGDLTGHEAEFEKLISSWNSNGLKIQIRWTKKAGPNDLVTKIFVDLRPGDRSYVDNETLEMHLSPFEEATTFVHEMGHVLGLPDEYYPYFDAKNCRYRYLMNHGNIMSDSETGKVLLSHIRTLKILYFSNFQSSVAVEPQN